MNEVSSEREMEHGRVVRNRVFIRETSGMGSERRTVLRATSVVQRTNNDILLSGGGVRVNIKERKQVPSGGVLYNMRFKSV